MTADSTAGRAESEPRHRFPATAVFVVGAGLLWFATRIVMPWLNRRFGLDPTVAWFVAGAAIVFMPLLGIAALLLRLEAGSDDSDLWVDRLRFRPPARSDWKIALWSLLLIGVSTGVIALTLLRLHGPSALHPSFIRFAPLGPGRYWILAAWLPFWGLNIMGEEIVWRGVLLPRQEAAHGRGAWLVHGLGWAVFHIPFGWGVLLLLLPTVIGLPLAVQRTRNTWVGVIVHAALNGPSFVAVSLGLIG